MFTGEELEGLRQSLEIGREELLRFFTLTTGGRCVRGPGTGSGPTDRLGLAGRGVHAAVAGFVPDDVASAPPARVARLAGQFQVDPDGSCSYGRRATTRTEHLRLTAQYLGWRAALEVKKLDELLLARAMEHDSPTLLLRLASEYLISARVTRPGPVTARAGSN